ncbi:MAG: TIGR02757 family protein [Rikenellaceae bacterium]|nr:TIGR02757 family protein [Rikenellaceae bacterium]
MTEQLKDTLEYLHDKYNCAAFVEDDPISIPHSFARREDIEISGFLASTIAWGNRKAIVRSASRMMEFLDGAPADFVAGASEQELNHLRGYVHRTFNGEDLVSFVLCLRGVVEKYGSLGGFFEGSYQRSGDMRIVLSEFRREFFAGEHTMHSLKHLSSIDKGAACKRLNMFLRWMVRSDARGVDFGLWRSIPASALYLPLDVHSGNMARALGLLARRSSDWKAVEEVTSSLRVFDKIDPVKYAFALFGAGIDGYLKGANNE